LLNMQTKLDPIKRDSVKSALAKVTTGTDLAKSLGVSADQDAVWKQKYGNLVKAFAYKYADDPNFDTKLSEFVEKNILSKLVTSWFSGDATDRQSKFESAKAISGELPQRRATDKKPTITPEEARAELKRRGK
jgi:hypothetical protein